MKDFGQIDWDEATIDDCRQLIRLAVREDLDRQHDWTTVSLVDREATAQATVVARQAGTIAGVAASQLVLEEMHARVECQIVANDGHSVNAGDPIAMLTGSARDMLTCERIFLNFLGRLSGIASLTTAYVQQTQGTRARVYDTRKTTPGWRRIEKFAVRMGGGRNHRCGLYDAVLIKDNHIAYASHAFDGGPNTPFDPASTVDRARQTLANSLAAEQQASMLVEIEVDTLEQLEMVLVAQPDIVLLDNMTLDQLRHAVGRRDAMSPSVQLEASGGVTLETVAEIASTGVDRISVGALTHSATALDISLDWTTW